MTVVISQINNRLRIALNNRYFRRFSPGKIDEIIEFAEYLKKKSKPTQKAKKKAPGLKIPVFHLGHISKQALDREKLYGEYLDRKFD